MHSVKIDGATRFIGESQGYNGLAVRDVLVNCTVNGEGTPCMMTAWKPNAKELAALNAGAAIYVNILGTQHPPILLETGPAS